MSSSQKTHAHGNGKVRKATEEVLSKKSLLRVEGKIAHASKAPKSQLYAMK